MQTQVHCPRKSPLKKGNDAFSPGTDSDYITEVTSKDQILKMQENYNNNINDFLKRMASPRQAPIGTKSSIPISWPIRT
ncbi:MAG: hypothetical protein R3D30_10505 [Hyphomicrobiales bacterium]